MWFVDCSCTCSLCSFYSTVVGEGSVRLNHPELVLHSLDRSGSLCHTIVRSGLETLNYPHSPCSQCSFCSAEVRLLFFSVCFSVATNQGQCYFVGKLVDRQWQLNKVVLGVSARPDKRWYNVSVRAPSQSCCQLWKQSLRTRTPLELYTHSCATYTSRSCYSRMVFILLGAPDYVVTIQRQWVLEGGV